MSETSSIDYASSIEHISALTAANVPYLWVTTHEESRFIKDLCAGLSEKEIWTWSSYSGLIKYEPLERITRATGELEKSNNPVIALQYIADYKKKESFKKGETEFEDDSHSVWILKDFNTVLSPPIARQMRDLYRTLVRGRKIVIIVAPVLGYAGGKTGMEPTLEKQITVIPYELPSKEAIEKRVKSVINNFKKVEKVLVSTGEKKEVISYSEDDVNRFTTALQGLTQVEADNAIMTSICHLGKIDEKKLMREKKQIIQRSEILEYIGNTPALNDVGGLDLAKKYFKLYSNQFSKEAEEFGVEPLRGVLFVGPPGTGKSLICKSVSAEWHLPLIRLDVGKVMGGIVGQSEGNMRAAIASAIACAPAILWLDEIEKTLSGTKSSNQSDGGTLSRVFGTLLTAMEEGMKGLVILATSNDISALPPELIRRFNEVMFVDLPVPEEREEIFTIHFRKRERDLSKMDLDLKTLAKITHGFTGSEIEKAVKEGIARAFQAGRKNILQEDLVGAIKDTKCISKIMKEQIETSRDWARDRARYASSLAEKAASPGGQKVVTSGGKELDLDGVLSDLTETKNKQKQIIDSDLDRFDNIGGK